MPPPYHVIFLGTSAFAVPSLEALARDPTFAIDLVVTQPDKPVGRKQELTPPPVKIAAQKLGLRIFQPANASQELPHALNSQFSILNFQFLVVVSYGQILSQEILDKPTIAPVNVHASLLPRWRGASPIQHAILEGDRETGVTVQHMIKELDAGPILSQEKDKLSDRETFTSLHDRLAVIGAVLLIQTLKSEPEHQPQPKSGITICKKLSRKDGEVNAATMTAEEIDRKVRALNPWPGVTLKNLALKLLETSLTEHPNAIPLPCRDNSVLYLVKVQPAGKKLMTGKEWQRGQQNK